MLVSILVLVLPSIIAAVNTDDYDEIKKASRKETIVVPYNSSTTVHYTCTIGPCQPSDVAYKESVADCSLPSWNGTVMTDWGSVAPTISPPLLFRPCYTTSSTFFEIASFNV